MRKYILKVIIYILLLLTAFIAYQPLMEVDRNFVVAEGGVADASELDLSKDRARIYARNWEYYPEHLYTPEDFANGTTIDPIYNINENPAEFGTYRVTILLPAGKTYGISGKSLLFSQRVYINGELIDETGSPGTSAETTVPSTKMYSYYFTPQSGIAEIIFHVSNFQMKDGGGAYSFSLGEAPLIQAYRLHRTAGSIAVIGCLVTVALLFIGMFIFFKERRYFLWYAMLSLMIAVRGLFTGDKPVMEILPELSWTLAIRAEYISLILIVVFAVLYFRKLYRETMPDFVFYPMLGLSAVYGGIAALTKPIFFSVFNPYYAVCWIAAGLWILVRLAMRMKRGGMERVFVFIGLLCFILTGINDMIQYTFPIFMQFEDTVTIGMLLFVFMNMTALFFGFAQTEAALCESHQKAKEEAAKAAFYRQMSHALRTPLTKISTNIQTARRRPEEADELLTKSQDEIMKMAQMISDALKDGDGDPEKSFAEQRLFGERTSNGAERMSADRRTQHSEVCEDEGANDEADFMR